MDTETKEKLTEQQHQIEMLRNNVEAKMETMEANNKATLSENKTAIERLIASNERFRSDIEKAVGELRTTTERNSRVLLLEIAGVMGLGVAVISLIVGLIVS